MTEQHSNYDDLDKRSALLLACFFLAQGNSPDYPHNELGFKTSTAAFNELGKIFSEKPSTVKNIRDAFDYHTDSHRVGWKKPLLKSLQIIFDAYKLKNRGEISAQVKYLISKNWENFDDNSPQELFDFFKIIADDNENTKIKTPYASISVEFSNTGARSDGWFVLSIYNIKKSLFDISKNLDNINSHNYDNLSKYEEATWRKIFDDVLTDEPARSLAKTQTLPFFELISKIIHYSNVRTTREYKTIELAEDKISKAIKKLDDFEFEMLGSYELHEPPIEHRTLQLFDSVAGGHRPLVTGGENIIFYGAPGTGKSHKVDTYEGLEQQFTVRTVFHADTQNSDFIGALKPGLVEDRITYAFAPGPFAQALAIAYRNPDRRVALIIEELNRAPAAAVFGELFLLLDRSQNGEGRYDVNFASPEFEKWFLEETGLKQKKIRLPSNLWVLATMNSSDQGVFPLDAAFRRRWHQEYLPINYDDAPLGNVNVVSDEGHFSVSWQTLLKTLNEFLSEEFRVVEDRLLGQRFLSEADLEYRSRLPQKVLLYLFDDLLRHEVNRDKLFLKDIRTIGDLITNSETGSAIFSSSFIERLPRQNGEQGNSSVGDE